MNQSDFNLGFQNQNTESKIVAALERISQAFRVLLWQESKEFSLTPIQVQVLIFLLYHGADKATVSYLAAEFNMTKATMSDAVKALEQKKLIIKTPQSHDSRSWTLELTPEGSNTALKNSLFAKEIRKPVEKLDTDIQDRLLESLIQIIQHLNQNGIISIQRMCLTCVHYAPDKNGATHFCNLLNAPLKTSDLRIDCPEFSQKN